MAVLFNPLGPVLQPELHLRNAFGISERDIKPVLNKHIVKSKNEHKWVLSDDDWLAFFWAGDQAVKNDLLALYHDLNPAQPDYAKNRMQRTMAVYTYQGILGLIFAEDLLNKPFDVTSCDLNDKKNRAIFEDLLRVFHFMRITQKGPGHQQPYLSPENPHPTPQDLKCAIKKFQEDFAVSYVRESLPNYHVTPDGNLREPDKFALFNYLFTAISTW